MKTIALRPWLLPAILLLQSSSLYAVGSGALGNQAAVSAKVLGHGFAYAGVADDAAAIFFNPGGLPQVKGWNLMIGASIIDFDSKHTSPSGQTDSMVDNSPIVPYLYVSKSLSDSPWAFGIGLNSPFGLKTEWGQDSFSQYWATESKLYMYMVNPTVAYQINRIISVGGGIDFANVFDVDLNQQIPGVSEGHGNFSGDGTGWGYNVGILLRPVERHSVGLAYRSQINVTVEGETSLTGGSTLAGALGTASYTTDAETSLRFPQSILVGYGFRPTDRWTFFADYEWVDWDSTDRTEFSYPTSPVNTALTAAGLLTSTISRQWRSTSNVGLGAEWKTNDWLDLRVGFSIYESPVPSETFEAAIPDGRRFAPSIGAGFNLGATSIDIAYLRSFLEERSINNNQGNLFASMDGKFEGHIDVATIGISYAWGD